MEKAILERLEWKLTVPTPYVFLVRFTRTFALSPDQQVIVIYLNSNTKNYQIQLTCFACHLIHIVQMKNMAFFLAELGRVHYGTANLFLPSMTAAAAVYAAQCTLNRKPLWNDEILKDMAGYTAPQIRYFTLAQLNKREQLIRNQLSSSLILFSGIAPNFQWSYTQVFQRVKW